MLNIINAVKHLWEFINKISPETRTILIILLFGQILYSQIIKSTYNIVKDNTEETVKQEKKAEQYTQETASEVSRHIRLIAQKDEEAFDVLLLSYHNSKQNLQGYKFLYLSCIAEAPKSLDTPLIGNQWSNLDYIYYIDELEKIHNQEVITISDINGMKNSLPKLYRLMKSSEAESVSFYVIEGKENPIGIVVILYKTNFIDTKEEAKIVMPSIQKLAILLDYENQ